MESNEWEAVALPSRSAPMEEQVIKCLREGMEAYSYRRMYALALEIRDCSEQTRSVNATALKVIAILGPIIEHPIARAAVLARADGAFWKMMIALACAETYS